MNLNQNKDVSNTASTLNDQEKGSFAEKYSDRVFMNQKCSEQYLLINENSLIKQGLTGVTTELRGVISSQFMTNTTADKYYLDKMASSIQSHL